MWYKRIKIFFLISKNFMLWLIYRYLSKYTSNISCYSFSIWHIAKKYTYIYSFNLLRWENKKKNIFLIYNFLKLLFIAEYFLNDYFLLRATFNLFRATFLDTHKNLFIRLTKTVLYIRHNILSFRREKRTNEDSNGWMEIDAKSECRSLAKPGKLCRNSHVDLVIALDTSLPLLAQVRLGSGATSALFSTMI